VKTDTLHRFSAFTKLSPLNSETSKRYCCGTVGRLDLIEGSLTIWVAS
jgi:hypothetical protein